MKLGKKILIIFITLFILFILVFSIIFSIININNDKILIGIKIDGIDISNLSINEAKEKIDQMYEQNIKLTYKEIEQDINISSIILEKDTRNSSRNSI